MNIRPDKFEDDLEKKIVEFLKLGSIAIEPYETLNDVRLLEDNSIDSLGIVQLTVFLEQQFDIVLDEQDFVPENFATADSLIKMLRSKLGKSA